jgi:acyl dehydratase
VRPSDTLATSWTVLQKLDKPKHAGGIVVMKCASKNQHGDIVVEADGKILVASKAS